MLVSNSDFAETKDSQKLDIKFMEQALRQAKLALDEDEVPVGTVITHQGRIIAKSHNQVELLKDPTAHAEMIAITQASSYLQSKWLLECCDSSFSFGIFA